MRSAKEWAKELVDRWITIIYGEDFLGDFVNRKTADSLVETIAAGCRAYAREVGEAVREEAAQTVEGMAPRGPDPLGPLHGAARAYVAQARHLGTHIRRIEVTTP